MRTGFWPLTQLEKGDHFSWEHTPERVFIVVGKIDNQLFFRRVGGLAHDIKITLNYEWKQRHVRRVPAPSANDEQKERCVACWHLHRPSSLTVLPDGRRLCGSCQRAEKAAAPA